MGKCGGTTDCVECVMNPDCSFCHEEVKADGFSWLGKLRKAKHCHSAKTSDEASKCQSGWSYLPPDGRRDTKSDLAMAKKVCQLVSAPPPPPGPIVLSPGRYVGSEVPPGGVDGPRDPPSGALNEELEEFALVLEEVGAELLQDLPAKQQQEVEALLAAEKQWIKDHPRATASEVEERQLALDARIDAIIDGLDEPEQVGAVAGTLVPTHAVPELRPPELRAETVSGPEASARPVPLVKPPAPLAKPATIDAPTIDAPTIGAPVLVPQPQRGTVPGPGARYGHVSEQHLAPGPLMPPPATHGVDGSDLADAGSDLVDASSDRVDAPLTPPATNVDASAKPPTNAVDASLTSPTSNGDASLTPPATTVDARVPPSGQPTEDTRTDARIDSSTTETAPTGGGPGLPESLQGAAEEKPGFFEAHRQTLLITSGAVGGLLLVCCAGFLMGSGTKSPPAAVDADGKGEWKGEWKGDWKGKGDGKGKDGKGKDGKGKDGKGKGDGKGGKGDGFAFAPGAPLQLGPALGPPPVQQAAYGADGRPPPPPPPPDVPGMSFGQTPFLTNGDQFRPA